VNLFLREPLVLNASERKIALDTFDGRYSVTARLFNIISKLSHDKQFILYKQLVKDNIKAELFKLIIDMSEDEKTRFLMQLGSQSYDYEPIKTVNLDDDESFMRENPRKICMVKVKYEVENRSFKSYIIDISKVGVFIESNDRFPVGQKIKITFNLPNYHIDFQLNGGVVRSGPRGIGVKFYNLAPDQEESILKYIESKK
jgi:Tfp pilus assembly protein PilZ